MQVLAHSPLYGVSLTNLKIPPWNRIDLKPCLKPLHKIGKLDERDAIMCSESQVYHDGEGHEVCHPGRNGRRISIPNQAPTLCHSASGSCFCGQVTQDPVAHSKIRIWNTESLSSASDVQHLGHIRCRKSATRVSAFWFFLWLSRCAMMS